MLSIINNILDYTKIEVGKLKLEPVEYDLHDLLYNIIRIFQVSIRATRKQISLESKIDNGLPRLLIGDEVRVRQVMVNIIDNALKFTREGKITITVELENTPDGSFALELFRAMGCRNRGLPQPKAQVG